MARRNLTPRENEIIFAGARAGLARTVIADHLRAEGFVRAISTLSAASSYDRGRKAAAEARVQATEQRKAEALAASRRDEQPDRIRFKGVSLPRLKIQADWTMAVAR